MLEALADWLKRWRERSELGAMDASQRDGIAHDLGISTAELEFLTRKSHEPKQLPLMVRALGIDEAALRRREPALLRDMERTCSICRRTDMCKFSLREGIADLTYVEFCPNADSLMTLPKASHAPSHQTRTVRLQG